MTVEAQTLAALTAAAANPQELADAALFEQWAKEQSWPALAVGLPLALGLRPEAWPRLLASVSAATTVQTALARALQIPPADDASVAPTRLRSAVEQIGIRLPPYLAQLLEFLGRVLPEPESDALESGEAQILAAQERETLLGIALLLVTRMPRDCLDDEGYFSAERITDLVFRRSARWFPLAPPTLDRDGIKALIAGWITLS